MKAMAFLIPRLIKGVIIGGLMSLAGCSSFLSSRIPITNSVSMAQVYNQAINGVTVRDNKESFKGVPSQETIKLGSISSRKVNYSPYTRTQKNEINSLFPRLANPDIVMYVYPHLSGVDTNQVPIPGYATVFSLYNKSYYIIQ